MHSSFLPITPATPYIILPSAYCTCYLGLYFLGTYAHKRPQSPLSLVSRFLSHCPATTPVNLRLLAHDRFVEQLYECITISMIVSLTTSNCVLPHPTYSTLDVTQPRCAQSTKPIAEDSSLINDRSLSRQVMRTSREVDVCCVAAGRVRARLHAAHDIPEYASCWGWRSRHQPVRNVVTGHPRIAVDLRVG